MASFSRLACVIVMWSAILVAGPATAAAEPSDDARALLEGWLDVQNRGDFAGYQALYARGFMGVRRSSNRTVTLDRDGWMRDRARMFEKKMTVEARDVRVFAKPNAARIVFTQTWSSGSYRDVGPKHLLVRRGPDGLRIFREELFASTAQGAAKFDPAAFQRFAFVVDGEIVVTRDPEETWAAGPARLDGRAKDLVFRVRRTANTKKLPREVTQLAGTRVALFDARGKRCEATIGAFKLRGRGVSDGYEGAEEAEQAWALSHPMLVATIDGDRKACAGATWARSAALPVPPIAPATLPDPALQKQALAAFRALPEARVIQRRFARWHAGEYGAATKIPDWFSGSDRPAVVRVMTSPAGGPVLLSVSASFSVGGCGEAGAQGSLWGLWQVEGEPDAPRLVLRNQPDESMHLQPSSAVDTDGDGRPEILFGRFSDDSKRNAAGQAERLENGFVRALGDSYIGIEGVALPIYICPC
jgi:ketosteroid isomerase-like protein